MIILMSTVSGVSLFIPCDRFVFPTAEVAQDMVATVKRFVTRQQRARVRTRRKRWKMNNDDYITQLTQH